MRAFPGSAVPGGDSGSDREHERVTGSRIWVHSCKGVWRCLALIAIRFLLPLELLLSFFRRRGTLHERGVQPNDLEKENRQEHEIQP